MTSINKLHGELQHSFSKPFTCLRLALHTTRNVLPNAGILLKTNPGQNAIQTVPEVSFLEVQDDH